MALLEDDAEWIGTDKLAAMLSITPMTIWRWSMDPEIGFPRPVVLNPNRKRQLKRWRKSEVEAWLLARVVQRVEKKKKKRAA